MQGASPAPTPQPEATCHPIVSGCGCAYQCATAIDERDGDWRVTHDFQDSEIADTSLERWCFDSAGYGFPEAEAPAEAERCLLVFYDRTLCGGECSPTTAYLDCRPSGERCVH